MEADLKTEQKKLLLSIARQSVVAAIEDCEIEFPSCSDKCLLEKLGCFVTLKTAGQLRGCLGLFVSQTPLFETVINMANEAATADPRFTMNRISKDEIDDVEIEISVLSQLKPTKDPLALRVGIDGIYIRNGMQGGCFLPQVATEAGWDAQEFLSYCCSHKAGLSPDAWKDPQTQVSLFTAEVFSESDFS